jgi:hypothetical protein
MATQQGQQTLADAAVSLPVGNRPRDIGKAPAWGVEGKDRGCLFHAEAILIAGLPPINPKIGEQICLI